MSNPGAPRPLHLKQALPVLLRVMTPAVAFVALLVVVLQVTA